MREVGVTTKAYALEAAPKTSGGGHVEGSGGALMGGAIAGTIDDAQDLAGVGQGHDENLIAPDAVVGDVHAAFALSGGGHQGAIGIQEGLVEEGGGLMLPNANAHVIEKVLQEVDVGNREASAEVARGRRIGDALGSQGVEIVDIVAAQFQVLQAIAVTQVVESDVQDVIGFGIGQADLEDGQAGIDEGDQAEVAGELMEERDAAVAEAMDSVSDFVAEVAAGEDRSRAFGKLGLVEPALDFALAGEQLFA